MNFESRFKNLEADVKSIKKSIADLKVAYEQNIEFTSVFLQCCEKRGICTVSIATPTDLIESCKGWHWGFEGHIFADEREGTWPAIWAVSEDMKISSGCGNSGQHQANCARLVDGVYKLQDGKWLRLEGGN